MTNDYRETKFCRGTYRSIKPRKDKLLEKIKNQHPKIENIYKIVSPRKSDFHSDFMSIYSYKCAYCGVSIDLISKSSFEIDHIVNKKSDFFKKHPGENPNSIKNLALACRTCNGNKLDFDLSSKGTFQLHPDDSNISQVFVRDEKYYIRIAKEYSTEPLVKAFYNKLQLGSEIHRLDYILMSLHELRKLKPEITYIDKAIVRLTQKRNFIA